MERLGAEVPRTEHPGRDPDPPAPGLDASRESSTTRSSGASVAALAEEAPEVVHVHTYGTNHAAVARRFSRSPDRTPYVLTAHYHPIWSIEGGWPSTPDPLVLRPPSRRADRRATPASSSSRPRRRSG